MVFEVRWLSFAALQFKFYKFCASATKATVASRLHVAARLQCPRGGPFALTQLPGTFFHAIRSLFALCLCGPATRPNGRNVRCRRVNSRGCWHFVIIPWAHSVTKGHICFEESGRINRWRPLYLSPVYLIIKALFDFTLHYKINLTVIGVFWSLPSQTL